MPSNDLLTHAGVVQAVDGGTATVAVAVAGCASCGQQKSCGVGRLAGGAKTTRVRVPAPAGVAPGDRVTLTIGQGAVNRAALLGYLLPAVLLVAGAIAGEAVAPGDAGAALGALAGLTAALAASRIIARSSGRQSALSIEPTRP